MANAVSAWLARAVADAKARHLPELAPLLESLSRSLEALRAADAEFGHPALPDATAANTDAVPGRNSSSNGPST